MKKVCFTLVAALVSLSAFGQGTILFNNRVAGQVDAPLTYGAFGFGAYAGAQAQLYLVSQNSTFTPLFPATTFRTTSPAAYPYVVQPTTPVVVPGVGPGQQATVVLRAWAGAPTYETATLRAQTAPITIALGGVPTVGAPIPDALLTGLQGFGFPEPSTTAIALLGGAALLFWRRK